MNDQDFSEFEAPPVISMYSVLDALLDDSRPLDPHILYRLSDLEGEDAEILAANWATVPLWRRQALVEDLPVLAEKDYVLSFEAIGRIAIADTDSRVRFGGVETLVASECENPKLISPLLALAETDEDDNVRAIAAAALGQFVYLGEMEVLQNQLRETLENRLIRIVEHDAQADVRQRALESLGFSSNPEVSQLITTAYETLDPPRIASALLAMGRSADDQWKEHILTSLDHDNDLVRVEAIRAAGELSLPEARATIAGFLDDFDQEIRMASIWALSQIGGKQVPKLLARQLKSTRDDEEASFIEEALDNLAFNADVEGGIGMFYVPDLDEIENQPEAAGWDRRLRPWKMDYRSCLR
jgi:HEAT repeat protein